jgi:hypothetical protein
LGLEDFISSLRAGSLEGPHNLEKNIFNFLKIVVDRIGQSAILDMKATTQGVKKC